MGGWVGQKPGTASMTSPSRSSAKQRPGFNSGVGGFHLSPKKCGLKEAMEGALVGVVYRNRCTNVRAAA